MGEIELETLRELFYKLYFIGYKDFVTNPQVCFGMTYDRKKGRPETYGNPYNLAITRYNSVSDTQFQVNIREQLPLRNFDDPKIMNSVDCFFQIIESAPKETIRYVYDLLHFMRDGGSQNDETLLKIEENIIRLILSHFWNKSDIDVLTIIKKTKGVNPNGDEYEYDKEFKLNKEKFFNGLENHNFTYYDVISMTGALLGGPSSKYYRLTKFLHAIRTIRNGAAHARENGHYNYSDASILNRFRLYTYIACVLYLQDKFVGTYSYPVSLHVQNMDETVSDDVEVSLYDEKGNELETAKIVNGICSFSIERYKKYEVRVKNSLHIEPTWEALSPIITMKSNRLEYYNNEFEVPSAARGATLGTVVELNKKVHETLTVISEEVNKIEENTKPLNKISEYVAKLSVHQDEEIKIAEQQTEILKGLQELMEELVKSTSNHTNNHDEVVSDWNNVMGKADKIYEQGKDLKDDIKNAKEQLSRKIDRNTKWLFRRLSGVFIVVCLVILVIQLFVADMLKPNVEDFDNLSAKEYLELGDSLLKASNYKGAGSAYRKAIDQFKAQISKNDNDVDARIQLGRMFYLGKGALNGDSAFFYINHKAVRADRHGRGVYAYCLWAKGRVEDAKKELKSIGIDENDDYVRLTSTLLELSGESSKHLTTVHCNKLINRLYAIGTEEAIIGAANIHYGGIRNTAGEYLIVPHIGLYYNVIKHLAPQVPLMYLYLSQISAFLHREIRATEYAAHAFDCGIHEESSLMLASLYAQGIYGKTEETSTFLDYTASLASQIDNTISLASNLFSYIDHGDFNLAIKAADHLEEMLKDSTRREYVSYIPTVEEMENLRISLRLMSGEKEHFLEAVKLALAKSRCKDSTAIALYLEAVQWAKAYGGIKDSVKSDSLINLSAELGYEEAVYTRLRIADYPTLYVDTTKDTKGHGYLNLGWGVDINSMLPSDGFLEVSKAAIVPDSIWKGDMKLTEYLAYYWKDYYIYTNQKSPYLSSCSRVFQLLYDIDKKIREGLMKNQTISDSERDFYVHKLLEVIPEAYYRRNYTSFVSLCREFCLFSEYANIHPEVVLAYKQFVDEMTKDYSIKPDNPIYAY